MPNIDAELLAHYRERGAEPWNVSLEAAWLDYELRAWVRPRLPTRWPAAVCNIGIGVGLWDDWLGHELGVSITSIDRDPEICRVFAARQRHELHPYPASVRCGDACDGVLARAQRRTARGSIGPHRHSVPAMELPRFAPRDQGFDAITIVGSTLAETTDRVRLEAAAVDALAPGGVVLIAEVGNREPPPADALRRLGEIWIAFRSRSA